MRARFVASAFACIFAILTIGREGAAGAPKRILPVASTVYALMDALYLEQGFAPAPAARPWAVDQAESMLEEIDAAGLSEAGAKAYDEIRRLLAWRPLAGSGDFAFGAGLDLSPEAFWHVRLGGDSGATDANYTWAHGAERRKSLFSIPAQAALGPSLFLELDIEAREEFDAVGVASNHFNAILDDSQPYLDINTPFKALASIGGPWWTLRFGRDALSWGNGATGDFMLSGWDEYHDYLGFDLFGRTMSLSGAYIAMEPYAPDAAALAAHGRNLGSGGSALADEVETRSSLAFIGHRLEFRPWKRLRFAVSESVIISGTGANGTFPDLVHDLNFLMIFHNWNIPKRANSLMTVEVSANPWKYIDLYGQFAMDEITTAYEASGDGGGGPFVGAWLGGIKAQVPAGAGYISIAGEYAQTSPWLYNRDTTRNLSGSVENASYYYDVRHYWSLVQDRDVFLVKPLGYGWGPDALIFWAKLGYSVPGSYSLSLDCTWSAVGENGIGSTWEPAVDGSVSPTGVAERRTILHLQGEAPLKSWLRLGGDAYYTDTRSRGHITGAWSRDLELAAHLTLQL